MTSSSRRTKYDTRRCLTCIRLKRLNEINDFFVDTLIRSYSNITAKCKMPNEAFVILKILN